MIALLALAAATPAASPAISVYADAIAAAERAFARKAQTEGQWVAFRLTAAPDALMFVPEVKRALPLLATAPEPAVAVMWWPATIIPACDGSLGISTGPWVRAASAGMGTFTTVWRRNGQSYRWQLDHGRPTPKLLPAGNAPAVIAPACGMPSVEAAADRESAYDKLAASVAASAGAQGAAAFAKDAAADVIIQAENAMPARGPSNLPQTRFGEAVASGHSDDWTLAWASRSLIGGDPGAHDLRVWQWRGAAGWKLVLYETVGVK